MTSKVIYTGNLRTEATHLKSGNTIITDAPTDNHGKGQAFSPTDLVATALASCAVTIMGIKANDLGVNIDGIEIEVTKTMASDPRRISHVLVSFTIPAKGYTSKDRKILERAALECPVNQTIREGIGEMHFTWLDDA